MTECYSLVQNGPLTSSNGQLEEYGGYMCNAYCEKMTRGFLPFLKLSALHHHEGSCPDTRGTTNGPDAPLLVWQAK